MSDRIEHFISGNREEFDNKIPSGKVWDEIEAAVIGKKKRKILPMAVIKWSVAAATVLIIGTVIYLKFDRKENTNRETAKAENIEIPGEPQVNEFAKLIVMKQEELKLIAKEQPDLYNKFTKDITQLDSSYIALKKELSSSPNKEMLIEAMIQNLQLQLSVLNQQLSIIKQIKQSKEYSHEKNI